MSISSELESSELEESEESEESVESESSASSFAFDAPFSVCFCLLSGSGDVDRLELLSLPEEEEAAMVLRSVGEALKLNGVIRSDARWLRLVPAILGARERIERELLVTEPSMKFPRRLTVQ